MRAPYKVKRERKTAGRRSLDVRLQAPLPEEELRALAVKLKAKARRSYPRTAMAFYLPGQRLGAGAWAAATFEGEELTLRILGSISGAAGSVKLPGVPAQDIIGRWFDPSPQVGGPMVIFRKAGQLQLRQDHQDGSESSRELREVEDARGRRFEVVGCAAGDHYIANAHGALEVRDAEGLIVTALRQR